MFILIVIVLYYELQYIRKKLAGYCMQTDQHSKNMELAGAVGFQGRQFIPGVEVAVERAGERPMLRLWLRISVESLTASAENSDVVLGSRDTR